MNMICLLSYQRKEDGEFKHHRWYNQDNNGFGDFIASEVKVVNEVLLAQSSFTIVMCVEYHCRSITAFVIWVDHLVVRLCSCWARSEGQKKTVKTSQRLNVTQVLEHCVQIVMGLCFMSLSFFVFFVAHNKLRSFKMWIPNKDITALITFYCSLLKVGLQSWMQGRGSPMRLKKKSLQVASVEVWVCFGTTVFCCFHPCLIQRNFQNNFSFW